jgi:membrane-bound serine protease (ClpP class)
MDAGWGLWPWYVGLLLAGIGLFGAELYLPGGIAGAIGAAALVGAMVLGFRFPAPYGLWSALLIIAATGAGVVWWARIFPGTRAGRRLSLQRDGRDIHAANPAWKALEGRTGRAVTALRPGGIAEVDGRRVDVVARSQWVDEGTPIRVTAVQGMRIIVEPAPPTEPG